MNEYVFTSLWLSGTIFVCSLSVILSLVIFYGSIKLMVALTYVIRDMRDCRKYKRFMNPEYWFFRGACQAGNPDCVMVVFENSESREKISLGIRKSELREFVR